MSNRWVDTHHSEFTRDVLRDYCMVCAALKAQFTRFEQSQTISFPVMRDILGTAMNKGLLWRLKDTAHHLFRHSAANDPLAQMLDWSIGYVFHECKKLKEDAYQHQHYVPQYKALHKTLLHEALHAVVKPLGITLGQTRESMEREVARIRYVLASSHKLFCLYLERHKKDPLLARFIHDNTSLVSNVFGEEYDNLLFILYEGKIELLHVYAAQALIDGGRIEEAHKALTMALDIQKDCPEALILQTRLSAMP